MKKYDKYRPSDPERQDAWHKAKLDLTGFMVQNRGQMSFGMLDDAERLMKTFDKYPSHSINRGWLVTITYGFMEQWEGEIKERNNNLTQLKAA